MTIGDEFYLDETQHNVSTGKVSEKSTYSFKAPLLFLVVLLPPPEQLWTLEKIWKDHWSKPTKGLNYLSKMDVSGLS